MKLKIGLPILIVIVILIGLLSLLNLWFMSGNDIDLCDKNVVVRVGGSTSLYPYARAAATPFMENHPDIIITVIQSSTGSGIKELIRDELDITNTSRLPLEIEYTLAQQLGKKLKVTQIGKEAVAIIVHPSKFALIQSLTQDQIKAIFFTGTIKDWSQLHPQLSGKINVYVRDRLNSGTAALIAKKMTGSSQTHFELHAIDVYIPSLIVPTVANDPNGIAFTPLQWVQKEAVKVIGIQQPNNEIIFPEDKSIINGDYLLTGNLYMVTLEKQKEGVEQFFEFAQSEKGQLLLKQEHLFGL